MPLICRTVDLKKKKKWLHWWFSSQESSVMLETQETQVQSLGLEDSLKEEIATWKMPIQRSLAGYNPKGGKESDMTEHTH